ncbi:BfmA/BtgA family mobilization protein [Pedobacter sp. SL55]|uniref:BfmA/BtgA family mobilization protein n=1 Tax=Pedobacter sp. SL55 TaxID=2995161 RepID=UPI0022712304|nr:BfmA/BtgA family mobilization protein [Pedobacter sp. SL55]WAC40377.1 BfmA/BtgA family mobilization protein [Pedobacter sp. SL55]
MEQENVNTVKYPAQLDLKFAKVALSLGLTKRELFVKMVEYFYRTKKDPSDINDELMKNTLAKNHKAYTSFIKAQENLLLIPMKESMDRMITNQKEIVKYFNEQVINANKTIIKNLNTTENLITKSLQDKDKLKALFLQILNYYIKSREELGTFKTREKEELVDTVRNQIKNL